MGHTYSMLRQLLALTVVYIFVFAYHGADKALFWWTIYNFAQVLVELLAARKAKTNHTYRKFEVCQDLYRAFENQNICHSLGRAFFRKCPSAARVLGRAQLVLWRPHFTVLFLQGH